MCNQNPEQQARDIIDERLKESGWIVQSFKEIDWSKGLGIAIKEYPTEVGPADYVLFLNRIPVGVIEAKKDNDGYKLTFIEEQSRGYAQSKLKYIDNQPLRFCYEATGQKTRFTDHNDPKPCSREVFSFHRPTTFQTWMKEDHSLRTRFSQLPTLHRTNLRECQFTAIANLEESFRKYQPRALIQMATGAGKTIAAITSTYRLLKFTKAKRVLFLVDRANLGIQAAQEFEAYRPVDDNRNLPKLYNITQLSSNGVPSDGQVYISTIQRLYSILRDEELDESLENLNLDCLPHKSINVTYNPTIPPEFFDLIIIDECHRSIYNEWKQVLDYFDAFLVGLTATPDNRTFAFFNQNVVSEYSHEKAVLDGVNVGFDIYAIETEYQDGAKITANQYVDKREKMTRKTRWEPLEEDLEYSGKDLDRSVVNPSQITAIIKECKGIIPDLFPSRKECPKTLIFAKSDSHADDIIQIVRREFGEGNDFCKKVTYKAEDEDPKSVLSQFRNEYNPRIVVTVDMIATGTDIKAIECLIFMRDVKSSSYYQQMLGRGTRTFKKDDLLKVSPSAQSDKTHFVVIDAVGVCRSKKIDMRPLEKKPSVPLKNLLNKVLLSHPSEDIYSSVASRLIRLDKQLTEDEHNQFAHLAKGEKTLDVAKLLLNAYNPDAIEDKAREKFEINHNQNPSAEQLTLAQNELIQTAKGIFTGELNTFIEKVQKSREQIIDAINIDSVTKSEWNQDRKECAEQMVKGFAEYIQAHKDEIMALSILYNEPHRRKEITYEMISNLHKKLKLDKPALDPFRVYDAYATLENSKGGRPKKELMAIISLIRRVTTIDDKLTNYEYLVDKNFKEWVFRKQSGAIKFSKEQMEWLHMIKDHIKENYSIEIDDLDMTPFNKNGGRSKMFHLFGTSMNNIISEIHGALVQ